MPSRFWFPDSRKVSRPFAGNPGKFQFRERTRKPPGFGRLMWCLACFVESESGRLLFARCRHHQVVELLPEAGFSSSGVVRVNDAFVCCTIQGADCISDRVRCVLSIALRNEAFCATDAGPCCGDEHAVTLAPAFRHLDSFFGGLDIRQGLHPFGFSA